jgi:hypothetical protein
MATALTLYAGEWGHKIIARTYCDAVSRTSAIRMCGKRASDGTTFSIVASRRPSDTTYYAVSVPIPASFMTGKTGEWCCQIELTFTTGKFYSRPFYVHIHATPSK